MDASKCKKDKGGVKIYPRSLPCRTALPRIVFFTTAMLSSRCCIAIPQGHSQNLYENSVIHVEMDRLMKMT